MNTHDRDVVLDHRARIEHERLQAEAQRRHDLAEQISPHNSASARIRVWERRHHLSLPQSADHRLVDVIAAATALTSAEVREEQRQRCAPVRPAMEPGS